MPEEDTFWCSHCDFHLPYEEESSESNVCYNCYGGRDDYDEEETEDDYMPTLRFLPSDTPVDKAKYLYMGIEMETDLFDNIEQARDQLRALDPQHNLFWCVADGSLRNGIEIITQPATLQYHKEKFPWKEIVEIVKKNGGTGHDSGTCGLHVHFNSAFLGKPSTKVSHRNVFKLLTMYNKFWGDMMKFSRRTEEQLHWCRKNSHQFPSNAESALANMPAAKQQMQKYFAVNLNSCDDTGHIEIRLFRGTINLASFFASLEFLDWQLRYIRGHTFADLTKESWTTLISSVPFDMYPNLYPYLKKRKLIVVKGEKARKPLDKERINELAKVIRREEKGVSGGRISTIAARRRARAQIYVMIKEGKLTRAEATKPKKKTETLVAVNATVANAPPIEEPTGQNGMTNAPDEFRRAYMTLPAQTTATRVQGRVWYCLRRHSIDHYPYYGEIQRRAVGRLIRYAARYNVIIPVNVINNLFLLGDGYVPITNQEEFDEFANRREYKPPIPGRGTSIEIGMVISMQSRCREANVSRTRTECVEMVRAGRA